MSNITFRITKLVNRQSGPRKISILVINKTLSSLDMIVEFVSFQERLKAMYSAKSSSTALCKGRTMIG